MGIDYASRLVVAFPISQPFHTSGEEKKQEGKKSRIEEDSNSGLVLNKHTPDQRFIFHVDGAGILL